MRNRLFDSISSPRKEVLFYFEKTVAKTTCFCYLNSIRQVIYWSDLTHWCTFEEKAAYEWTSIFGRTCVACFFFDEPKFKAITLTGKVIIISLLIMS